MKNIKKYLLKYNLSMFIGYIHNLDIFINNFLNYDLYNIKGKIYLKIS